MTLPAKLLREFHLGFRQDGMVEALRGENYRYEAIARPGSTTLVRVKAGSK